MEYTVKQLRNFWKKVDKTDTCWNWTAARFENGYGVVRISGKNIKAHRMSWEIHFSEIPEGLHVLHKCDNKLCINPEHLFIGTHQDNMSDMANKKRSMIGERNYGHKLSEEDIFLIKSKLKSGWTREQIASDHNLSRGHLNKILRGDSWSYLCH